MRFPPTLPFWKPPRVESTSFFSFNMGVFKTVGWLVFVLPTWCGVALIWYCGFWIWGFMGVMAVRVARGLANRRRRTPAPVMPVQTPENPPQAFYSDRR